MIHDGSFTVVLDACVLYPASIRDILLLLAAEDLYRPKWTEEINNEWKINLLESRDDLEEEQLDHTIKVMNQVFRDAEVRNYKGLIPAMSLPDPNDRHVLAAAIRCNADLIVTENLKDFSKQELQNYDIESQSSDVFVQNLIDLDQDACCMAFNKQRKRLTDPPKSREEMRDTLQNAGLKVSATTLYTSCEDD